MIECEKKVILTEDEYLFLKNHRYSNGIFLSQINHYYDSDRCELCNQGITCRIREKDGIYTATIKERQHKWSEYSIENSRIVKNCRDIGFFSKLNVEVTYHGSLKTDRTVYSPHKFVSVMLDKNIYLGTVDYELEIEYEQNREDMAIEELENAICDLLTNQIISDSKEFRSRINSSPNKSARFFNKKYNNTLKGEF